MSFSDIFKASQYKKEAEQLRQQLDSLCYNDYQSAQQEIGRLNAQANGMRQHLAQLQSQINAAAAENERIDKQLKTSTNKL